MTKEEAEQQGYHQCGFCFKKVLYLPDLAVEMDIEREWSARIRKYEPLMDGTERQIYLSRLGKKLLQNWPVQLQGYNYSFHLIKSNRMNAIAIPTGKIVISTALMDALDNEEELEALLLLAIAHIEGRHSLKQYLLNLDDIKNSNTMKSLLEAAGSVASMFPGGSLIGTLGSLPFQKSPGTQSQILGFEEDFEKEADAMTALYFDLNHEDKRNLSSLIKKMQLAGLAEQLHPEFGDGRKDFFFNDRIKRVEDTKFLYFKDGYSFVFKKKNRLPVQLDLLYQSVLAKENKLIVYISDKSLLSALNDADDRKSISLLIQDQNEKQEFKLLEKFTTEDLWGARLTFKASGKKNQQFVRDIESVKLVLATPQKPTDRQGERLLEHFTFFKGKLDY